jgi:hypothetical protein
MSTGRIVGIVIGSLVLLTGLACILGGGGVLVAERVLADESGYVSLRSRTVEQDAHAVVAPILIEGSSWFWRQYAVTLRLDVTGRGADAEPLFIGLADRVDVDRYLGGVQTAKVRSLHFPEGNPQTRPLLRYEVTTGTIVPEAPTAQRFWLESASGTKAQSLEWRLEAGDYSLVLMNADGSRGIDASVSVGAKAPIVLTVAAVILGVGAVLFALGLVAIILSVHGVRGVAAAQPPAAGGDTGSALGTAPHFPLSFQAEYSETLSPALWLVKWFLLIPHYVVLGFLWTGFVCSWGLSLLAILFTGRYPRGLFEYNVGVLRWTWRVGFYGYQALGTDQYPPFTLRAGGYPADLDVVYPERLSRRLALVKWWLLAIPHYLIMAFLVGAGPHWGALVAVLTVVVGVLLLLSSRYPRELFAVIVGANRWAFRVLAYAALMTDVYPPFRIDG